MKALVVYYSYSANNESLARELKVRLGCDAVKIEEQNRRTSFTIFLDLLFHRDPKIKKPEVFLSDYNVVIFVSPIWASKIASPLKSYIKMQKGNISKYAFITISAGAEGQTKLIEYQLTQLIGHQPLVVTELAINNLLPIEQRNKIKYTTPYRIKKSGFEFFKKELQQFVNTIFAHASELTGTTAFVKDKTLV